MKGYVKPNIPNRAPPMAGFIQGGIRFRRSNISSVPYKNANPKKINSWINDNFNNDKVYITIEGVKFTLIAPSKAVRTLLIEKDR